MAYNATQKLSTVPFAKTFASSEELDRIFQGGKEVEMQQFSDGKPAKPTVRIEETAAYNRGMASIAAHM